MKGYWEPHSSSIDFCETNYLHSNHIVEIHNTWSSIVGIALFGAIGVIYGNPTKEWRFTIAYTSLMVIGIGSAFLHGTLHWVFQSSDELPMIYFIITGIYILLEVESPLEATHVQSDHARDDDGKLKKKFLKYPNLPLQLVALSIANTLIYYKFQSFYWVFILTFTSATALYLFMVGMMVYKGHEMTKNVISRQMMKLALLSFNIVATPIWIIDMLHCEWSLATISSNMYGMTPHVIWHFTAGYGAYCTIVYLETFRMQGLRRSFSAKFLLGCIPIIIDDGASAGAGIINKDD